MDRKSLIIVVLSLVFYLLWVLLLHRLYPTRPVAPTNAVAFATNLPAVSAIPGATASISAATNSVGAASRFSSVSEESLVVTNDTAYYHFTSHGGGLKLVELRQYPESVECHKKKSSSTNNLATLNARARLPALALIGGERIEGDSIFQLSRTGAGIRAEKLLPNGIAIVKDFEVGTNYLVTAKVRLENRSAQPVSIPAQEWVIGTAAPIGTNDTGQNVGVFWYNGARAEHIQEAWFQNRTMGCVPGTARSEYSAGITNVVWAAVHNQFFTMAVVPRQPAGQVVVTRELMPAEEAGVSRPAGSPRYQTALVYPAVILTNGQSIAQQFTIYAGPKEYNRLARLGSDWNNNLDLVMDFGRFFGFFAKALLLSMNGLRALSLPYGLAIILITVIIKTLFWPLTRASTRSMKRMQKLQPQMKALQEKYKDDPKKMNMKLMEFMKEHKVSPIGGCLPMMLQIPVFIGFYQMLQSAIELRGASFLWACDLSKPDTIFVIGGFPINPLPLVMGVTMLWQARLTPPSPGMDPVQQKIMKYMPLMFIAFLYKMSSGLTLYWTVQNLLTIAQMKLTKPDDEAAGTAPPGPPVTPRPVNWSKKKK